MSDLTLTLTVMVVNDILIQSGEYNQQKSNSIRIVKGTAVRVIYIVIYVLCCKSKAHKNRSENVSG